MEVVKFEFMFFGINTYVVVDKPTKKCAIIDPGMFVAEERNAMSDYINRNDLQVTHIINTHLHIDHVVGNAYARKTFGAPVAANAGDEMLGSRLDQQAQMFGLKFNVENVAIELYLKDGDEIRIGDGRLQVLHVPGHSQGSIALYDPDGGYVIAGDALFQGSIGRTDLPGGNHEQLIKSIKEKLLTLPAETIVYPGHGPETTIGKEASANPFIS